MHRLGLFIAPHAFTLCHTASPVQARENGGGVRMVWRAYNKESDSRRTRRTQGTARKVAQDKRRVRVSLMEVHLEISMTSRTKLPNLASRRKNEEGGIGELGGRIRHASIMPVPMVPPYRGTCLPRSAHINRSRRTPPGVRRRGEKKKKKNKKRKKKKRKDTSCRTGARQLKRTQLEKNHAGYISKLGLFFFFSQSRFFFSPLPGQCETSVPPWTNTPCLPASEMPSR